jgi:peptidoglycan/LPS O-acetylase OafA/YrhL
VAVLLVVIYHSGVGLPGGFVGVDVFFVISGYVITRMLAAELAGSGGLDLKRFYLRRIRRLLPALGLMLSIVMLASSLLAPIGGQQVTARTGAAAALFNANTYLARLGEGGYFDVSSDVNALLHTWSLSVEEQFYLVFPALLFGAWVLGRKLSSIGSMKSVIGVLSFVAVASFVLSLAFTNGHTGVFGSAIDDSAQQIAFYSPLTRAWQFAVGGLLALAAPRLLGLGRAVATALAVGGLAMVLFAAFAFDKQTPFPGTAALLPTVGTLFILAAGEKSGGNPFSRALGIRPARYLGDLSYSWYLWHWPSIVFAAALWPGASNSGLYAALFSLLPAWLAYRLVESPIRFASRPPTIRTLGLGAACIALPLVSAVVLAVSPRVTAEQTANYEGSFDGHIVYERGCSNNVPLGQREQSECTWEVDDPKGVAVLIGDSNAGHFSEAFIGATNGLGMNAIVAVLPGCPFVDLVVVSRGEPDVECRQFVTESMRFLRENPPDLVVLTPSEGKVEEDSVQLELADEGVRFSTSTAKASAWRRGMEQTITQLQSAGVDVVVVQPVPKLADRLWDHRDCAVITIMLAPSSCGTSTLLTEANEERARTMDAISAAAAATEIPTLDVADELCPRGVCSTQQGATWMYLDGGHISPTASVQLTPVFVEFLKPVAP